MVFMPKDPTAILPTALFVNYRTKDGRDYDPEIYPRNDGSVYICGVSEIYPVPDDPLQILPKQESLTILHGIAKHLSSKLADAEVTKTQACYLPCIPGDGLPLIGAIPQVAGLYAAAGHSCWGMLNAPITGVAIAELIVDGKITVSNFAPFDPSRYVKQGAAAPAPAQQQQQQQFM